MEPAAGAWFRPPEDGPARTAAAIIGYSEMLQEEVNEAGDPRFAGDLQKINAAGRHLLELINAVLDLAKIEAGKMELHLDTFSVATMVNDIPAVIEPLAHQHRNAFHTRLDGDVGVMRAGLTKTRQVLPNLLSNACKFTQAGRKYNGPFSEVPASPRRERFATAGGSCRPPPQVQHPRGASVTLLVFNGSGPCLRSTDAFPERTSAATSVTPSAGRGC